MAGPSIFWESGRGRLIALAEAAALLSSVTLAHAADEPPLAGAAAFSGATEDRPGLIHHLTPADLPAPYATPSVAAGSHVARPDKAMPMVPPGFQVELYASGLIAPRLLRTAPNGDVFAAQSEDGSIVVLRPGKPGAPRTPATYIRGLNAPFGIAFYPPGPDPHFLYVGATDAVLRFPYRNGDLQVHGNPDIIVSGLPEGGHWTRDVAFSADGRRMYVSVGSRSNDAEGGLAGETHRANILVVNPDGTGLRQLATGMRNPVGLVVHPATGELWTAVNERDGLGDNLPPDYVTRVVQGGFYGWPWFYIGDHQDPRHKGERSDLKGEITLPDVLIQPHSAPLQLAVYTGAQFPPEYRNDLFVALHGSWNRAQPTGYKVVRVILHDGKPTGEYQDFVTGFVTADGAAWARPVGVTVAADGALLVSDDAGGTIWRVSYQGRR